MVMYPIVFVWLLIFGNLFLFSLIESYSAFLKGVFSGCGVD